MNVASQARHLLTSLTAVGSYLASLLLLTPAEVTAANDAGAQIIDPLAALLAVIAAAVVRLAMGAVFNLFRRRTGENVRDQSGSGGGLWLFVVIGTVAGVGFLPPCSPFHGHAEAASRTIAQMGPRSDLPVPARHDSGPRHAGGSHFLTTITPNA